MKKKLLSMLLALVMVLTLVPATAVTAHAATKASGACGDSATWTLSDDGTLTISGEGEMDSLQNWKEEYCPLVKKGVIQSGITSICASAFSNCKHLTSVTIPDSVNTIGIAAFAGTGITNIIIPSSVTYILRAAFARSNLKTVVFLGDLPSIGASGSEPFIFDGVTATAYYPAGNDNWDSILKNSDAVEILFSGNITWKPYAKSGACGDNATWILTDDGTLTISGEGEVRRGWDEEAPQIKRVIMQEGLTGIDSCAFSNCINLTDVTIPDSMTYIGRSAFEDTAFYNDSSNWKNGMLHLGTFLLYAKKDLTDCVIPEGVRYMAEEAFWTCTDLVSLSFPATMREISTYELQNCRSLSHIYVDENNPFYSSDGIALFSDGGKTLELFPLNGPSEYVIPDGVTTIIGSQAAAGNVGYFSFMNCENLKKVTIPSSVTYLGVYAFLGCSNLSEIIFQGDAPTFDMLAGYLHALTGLTTTIYYPAANTTWTEALKESLQKNVALTDTNLTWVAYGTASWQQDSHGWWYRNADGSYPVNCWQQIDGKWYHFDASGYMQTGWLKDGGKWYYLTGSGDMVTGWKEISGKWYFFNDGGDMVTGWKQIGSKWYYFNGGGDMVTGWKQVGSKWYYFTGSGDMVTGWKQIGSKWYYFNDGGEMVTGWKQIGSKWYYFNGGGDMVTGWKQIGSKWYYFTGSGDMVTGMQDIGGKRYFFNAGGDMVTGWKQLLSTWYYFNAGGDMATGWKQIGSHWYYFNEHGAMQVSRWIGDYYVKADGTMAVNEWVDFGRYYVGPDGKWTGQTRPANQTGTVYWTSGGEVYHTHQDCPTLSRSHNIQSGTVEEANQAGKDRLCHVCANMG